VVRAQEVDVLVVGARVAGSTVASLLGACGWRVLVVDRAGFPSPTLSTHFFRGAGCVGVLRTLGVLDEVLACGSPRLVREYNADAVTGTTSVDPPQDPGDIGFCLSVRRETLDAILIGRARSEPTVEVLEHTRLDPLLVEDGRVAGAELFGDSASQRVYARVVVGADGRASRVAARVGAAIQEQHRGSRAMYFRYAAPMAGPHGDPDGPEFSLGDDELAYVFPSDGATACVAVSVNLRRYAEIRPRAHEAFAERLADHPFLAARIREASWTGRLFGCGPRPALARVPAGPGWALVGDASLYQDPWTGLGMDNAAVHATFLAEALDRFLSGRDNEHDAMVDYHRRRDDHALAAFRETCELGRDLNAVRAQRDSAARS
jgi:flavin-dependent dehydrogenase